MGATDKLVGSWTADLERYPEVNPEFGQLPASMMDMMLGKMVVELTADTLAIKNYGGKDSVQEGTFTATEDGEKLILEASMGGSGRKGVFEVTFIDDDHINFNLVDPKLDPMALKRAPVAE